MTILFFGTSLMELVAGEPSIEFTINTTAAEIAPHVDEGIKIDNLVDELPILMPLLATTDDAWVSFYFHGSPGVNSSHDRPILEIRGGGKELFRLDMQEGGLGIEYHNDTVWVLSGTRLFTSQQVRHRFDFHFVIHDSTGTLTVYKSGVEVASTTFSAGDTLLRGESVADEIKIGGWNTVNSSVSTISALIVSTDDTRAMIYAQDAIDGNGNSTDWDGDFNDINEVGYDSADFIQGAANDDVELYTKGALPAALNSGYSVLGVGVSSRAIRGVTGPANLQLAVRENVTDGFSGNKVLDGTLELHQNTFILNPDTSLAWTFSEADAAEVGVKAIT